MYSSADRIAAARRGIALDGGRPGCQFPIAGAGQPARRIAMDSRRVARDQDPDEGGKSDDPITALLTFLRESMQDQDDYAKAEQLTEELVNALSDTGSDSARPAVADARRKAAMDAASYEDYRTRFPGVSRIRHL